MREGTAACRADILSVHTHHCSVCLSVVETGHRWFSQELLLGFYICNFQLPNQILEQPGCSAEGFCNFTFSPNGLGDSHFFSSSSAWGHALPFWSQYCFSLYSNSLRILILSRGISQSISSPVNYLFTDFAFFWCISCAFPICSRSELPKLFLSTARYHVSQLLRWGSTKAAIDDT